MRDALVEHHFVANKAGMVRGTVSNRWKERAQSHGAGDTHAISLACAYSLANDAAKSGADVSRLLQPRPPSAADRVAAASGMQQSGGHLRDQMRAAQLPSDFLDFLAVDAVDVVDQHLMMDGQDITGHMQQWGRDGYMKQWSNEIEALMIEHDCKGAAWGDEMKAAHRTLCCRYRDYLLRGRSVFPPDDALCAEASALYVCAYKSVEYYLHNDWNYYWKQLSIPWDVCGDILNYVKASKLTKLHELAQRNREGESIRMRAPLVVAPDVARSLTRR